MSENSRRNVAVIGAGPAGLMAAETLAAGGATVTVYDRMPSVGRKFLLAGRGGLNLTHSEDFEPFVSRYGAAAAHLRRAVEALTPADLRAWSEALGQKTFVGSSGRVFPLSFKTSPLLRAWLRRLGDAGVTFMLRHRWTGWSAGGELTFETPDGALALRADATVLALGGASWPRLGSDGGWRAALTGAGVTVTTLQPANCGFVANWSAVFAERFAGQPLKRIALSFGPHAERGEAIVTRTGLEGGAVYALTAPLREAIAAHGEAVLHISLRPDTTPDELLQRLSAPRGKQSLSNALRKAANLSPAGIGLLHEAAIASGARLTAFGPAELAGLIQAVPVRLTATAPLETAISTAGGIGFDEMDEHLMLRRLPGVFAAGEMLDWEAPTGGYLLQASFATGALAGRGALAWLARG